MIWGFPYFTKAPYMYMNVVHYCISLESKKIIVPGEVGRSLTMQTTNHWRECFFNSFTPQVDTRSELRDSGIEF